MNSNIKKEDSATIALALDLRMRELGVHWQSFRHPSPSTLKTMLSGKHTYRRSSLSEFMAELTDPPGSTSEFPFPASGDDKALIAWYNGHHTLTEAKIASRSDVPEVVGACSAQPYSELSEQVGKEFQRRREELGLSLAQVAVAVERAPASGQRLSKNRVAQIENGEFNAEEFCDAAMNIAWVLGYPSGTAFSVLNDEPQRRTWIDEIGKRRHRRAPGVDSFLDRTVSQGDGSRNASR